MKLQRGISLVVVMIVLTVMLLGFVGIFRSSNGTLSILGNLGFKQNATSVADVGVEVARAYLLNRSATQLAVTDSTGAYFEVGNGSFDPTTFDWSTSVVATPDDGTGNTVSYVIHRMCSQTGTVDAPNQQCVFANRSNAGGSNQVNSLTTGVGIIKSPFYRITARVQGPRNTLSYVQVMVY